ncbi:MAG TPA: glycosyltransferase [Candidatus Dormibacteraeota bacterium]|nr:glycosyltransferase [Candidatus Dormibacteraeota bacterium]
MKYEEPARSFLLVTWDGGGNLPPAIGIARKLASMGHRVRFLGHCKQRPVVEAAGLPFRTYERTPDYDSQVPISPEDFAPFLFDHLIFEPAMAIDLEAELARERTDAVLVDCMLTAPLAFMETRDEHSAVLVHTLHRFFDGWDLASMPGCQRLFSLRRSLDLPAVGSLHDTWLAADRVLVVSPLEFDPPRHPLPVNTVHVGPVADRNPLSATWDDSWGPRTEDPLVLVSFSTTAMDQEDLLNRVSEALSAMPVRVLMTTSNGIDHAAIRQSSNLTVRDFVPHRSVMPHVDLAICHAGHGTVMSALAHGVPLLCLPMGRDQPMVAERVEALGAGRSLGADADPTAIRRVVEEMLGDRRFRENSQRMASLIAQREGGAVAAEELQAMLRVATFPRPSAHSSVFGT